LYISQTEQVLTFKDTANISAAYFENNKLEECIKDCYDAIEAGRSQRADYKQIAKAYTRIGNAHMKVNKYADALEAYNHALAEDRNPQTLALAKKAEKAKEEEEKKSYLDPQKSQEAKERGNELFRQGKFPESIKEYSEAIARNPDDYTLYSNRAASYTKLMQYDLGLKDCDECISRKPDFGKYYMI
jgi:stress-induced-phosphoprotein 1